MPGFPASHKPLPNLAPIHEAQEANRYGQGRGGRPWRRKREAVMVRDKYRCQPCQLDGRVTLAVEVDHIVPQAEGGDDRESNLQAICGDCHEVKTRAEAARGVSRSRFGARPRGAKPTTPGGEGGNI